MSSVPIAILNSGQLDAIFDDIPTDGIAGETGQIMDVEFLREMLTAFLDGLHANAEFGR
jgi:hypothetical protein